MNEKVIPTKFTVNFAKDLNLVAIGLWDDKKFLGYFFMDVQRFRNFLTMLQAFFEGESDLFKDTWAGISDGKSVSDLPDEFKQ